VVPSRRVHHHIHPEYAGSAARCRGAAARQGPRIGYIGDTPGPHVEALRQGLHDLGYLEGQHLVIEYRWSEGKAERLPALAAELVHLPVDMLIAQGGQASRAAKQATSTIPIVMAPVGNPESLGLVASLARPGGNITGVSVIGLDVSGKRLELLKEAVRGFPVWPCS
jgi:putative ABC transport system substrate-binding protein